MATQIPTFAVTNLTLGSHSKFHTSAAELMTAAGGEVLHITDQLALYVAAVETEATIVNRQTSFVATEMMKEADKKRDDMLAVINGVINAHQYTHIEAKRTAQMHLASAYDPYRNIRGHEYSRQTAEVDGLIAVLTTDEIAPHLQALGLVDEVAALSSANAQFSTELDRKVAEMTARRPEKDISTEEARAESDRLYADIVAIVNAYALIQPTEAITAFVTNLNGLVDTYRLIASNTGKGKTEESEENNSEL